MSIVEKAADKLKAGQTARTVDRQQRSTGTDNAFDNGVRVDSTSAATDATPAFGAMPRATADRVVEPVHIDFDALERAGMYPSEHNVGHIADQYRRIKRPLLANVTGKGVATVENGRRIMVASSVPSEGKTFTSFNLALAMALERDHTALLIDGDVAKSDMTNILGLQDRPGLLDILDDERITLDQVIARTDVPRLKVLPSGSWKTLSTELLASRRMERLLDEINRTLPDCIVIFDSPPLLATSEAQVLAAAMGQVVVVVAAERTPQHLVKAALETLDQNKSINTILNLAKQGGDGRRYGDYYYGGYYNREAPRHA